MYMLCYIETKKCYSVGLALPGNRLTAGSAFVSYLAETFSLRQKPHGFRGRLADSLLQRWINNDVREVRLSLSFVRGLLSSIHQETNLAWAEAKATRNLSSHRFCLSLGSSMFAIILLRRYSVKKLM